MRFAVLLIALAVLYLRMPGYFSNPQFWAEDSMLFFSAHLSGWHVIALYIAGYLAVVPGIVAFFVSFLDPIFAGAAYVYSAIAMTLGVVWLVTSPRLDFPAKPLLALAVVIVPMGREELGAFCNIQWILPIGLFAIMFMRAGSPLVLCGEAVFVGLTALTGPFSVFLAPLYLVRTCFADQSNRFRLALLTVIVTIGGAIQAVLILTHPITFAPQPSPLTMWITIPANQIGTTFLLRQPFDGPTGAILGIILFVVAAALSAFGPYRTQKIFMLIFGSAIAFGGLYKFHNALATQALAQRYFYASSVFALWFICCLSDRPTIKTKLIAFVVVIELMALRSVRNTPYFTKNLEWPVWASYIDKGLDVFIPIAPDWHVGFAGVDGPLAKFRPMIGRNIRDVFEVTECRTADNIEEVSRDGISSNLCLGNQSSLWSISGITSNRVQIVAIADAGKIIGFGFPGFAPERRGWKAILFERPGENIQACGLNEPKA